MLQVNELVACVQRMCRNHMLSSAQSQQKTPKHCTTSQLHTLCALCCNVINTHRRIAVRLAASWTANVFARPARRHYYYYLCYYRWLALASPLHHAHARTSLEGRFKTRSQKRTTSNQPTNKPVCGACEGGLACEMQSTRRRKRQQLCVRISEHMCDVYSLHESRPKHAKHTPTRIHTQ